MRPITKAAGATRSRCSTATPEQLARSEAVAQAAFDAAKVLPLDAAVARFRQEGEMAHITREEFRWAALWRDAEAAAVDACCAGWPEVSKTLVSADLELADIPDQPWPSEIYTADRGMKLALVADGATRPELERGVAAAKRVFDSRHVHPVAAADAAALHGLWGANTPDEEELADVWALAESSALEACFAFWAADRPRPDRAYLRF
jgi:hypothetical protein